MLTTSGLLIYYLLLTWLIYRIVKRQAVFPGPGMVALAFGFKVLMACVYGYIFQRYYGGDDTWMFHEEGIREYHKLLQSPGAWFKDLLPLTAMQQQDGWMQMLATYNKDLEHFTFHKLLALCNVFGQGNYYLNAAVFSFVTFWGHYWLYRVLAGEFPHKKQVLLWLIFFLPPTVFWLSGIRTDGLIFLFLSLAILHFHHWVNQRRTRSLVLFLLAFAGLLVYRNALVLLLAPALAGWFLVVRYKSKPLSTYGLAYLFSIILFFGSWLVKPAFSLPGMVAARQHQFLEMQANTRFHLPRLDGSPGSYINAFPQAAANTFLRPFPWEPRGALQIMAMLGVLFFWLVVVAAVIKKERQWKATIRHPLVLTLLFFSVTLYLMIGYTAPFPGAIVRYKCIPELFLLALALLFMKPAHIYYKK